MKRLGRPVTKPDRREMHLRLDDDIREALQAQADVEGRSRSDIVNDALRAWLKTRGERVA